MNAREIIRQHYARIGALGGRKKSAAKSAAARKNAFKRWGSNAGSKYNNSKAGMAKHAPEKTNKAEENPL